MFQRDPEPLVSLLPVEALLMRIGTVIPPPELFRDVGDAAADDAPEAFHDPPVPRRVRIQAAGICEGSLVGTLPGQRFQRRIVQLPEIRPLPLCMEKSQLHRAVGQGSEIRTADLKNTFFLQTESVLQEMSAGAAAEGLQPGHTAGKQRSVQLRRSLPGQSAAVVKPGCSSDEPLRGLPSFRIGAVSRQQRRRAVQHLRGCVLPVGKSGPHLHKLLRQEPPGLKLRPELRLSLPETLREIRKHCPEPCQDPRGPHGLSAPVHSRAGKPEPFLRLRHDTVQVKALDPEILFRRGGETDLQGCQRLLLPVCQDASLLLQLRDQSVIHAEEQEGAHLRETGAGDVAHRDPVRIGRDLPYFDFCESCFQDPPHVVFSEFFVPEKRLHLCQDPHRLRVDAFIFPDPFGIARFQEALFKFFQGILRTGLFHQSAEAGADRSDRSLSLMEHRAQRFQKPDSLSPEGVQLLQTDPVQVSREILPCRGQLSIAPDPAAFHVGSTDRDLVLRVRDQAALQEAQEAPGGIPVRHTFQRCPEHLRQRVRGHGKAAVGIKGDPLPQEFMPELRLAVFKIRGDHCDLTVAETFRLHEAEDLRRSGCRLPGR